MTNAVIYAIDAIIFVIIVGGVINAIRKDVIWHNEKQRQKQSVIDEKR